MKVEIAIKYEINAQGDETEADEARLEEAVSDLIGVFANQVIDAGRSEGLTVQVSSS